MVTILFLKPESVIRILDYRFARKAFRLVAKRENTSHIICNFCNQCNYYGDIRGRVRYTEHRKVNYFGFKAIGILKISTGHFLSIQAAFTTERTQGTPLQ